MLKTSLWKMSGKWRITSRMAAMYALSKQESFLTDQGWFHSYFEKMPLSKDASPLPWITYPAISFLDGKTDNSMSVFEFGSGNSTIWWSERVRDVVSCEHDQKWYESLKDEMPDNVQYIHRNLNEGYCDAIQSIEHPPYDIVVIDGRDRVKCATESISSLKSDSGVILWDNSERPKYSSGIDFLLSKGFRRIDFWGHSPANTYNSCSSIFYRPENCLGI